MKPIVAMFVLICLAAALAYYLVMPSNMTNSMLAEAFLAYQDGEKAQNVSQRAASFNKALSIYTNLEDRFSPNYGDGKLYYNIGNSYFQLGQYPLAVFYYYRTLNLDPGDERTEKNLNIALEKLNIPYRNKNSVFIDIFFFHYKISLPNRLRLIFIFCTLSVILFSVFIWNRNKLIKYFSIIITLIAAILLFSVLYTQFLTPSEAVIVKSTSLYRDAGMQYARVQEEPILSGSKVEVLEILENGKWLKIITETGKVGYIPQESVKIL